MNAQQQQAYDQLCQHARETAMLESISALLNWDERTYLPPAGGEYRAEQITYLSSMIHQRRTDARLGQWLDELQALPTEDPHSDLATNIRWMRRDYEKQKKLPTRLVEELARCSVRGQQAWVEARRNNDFGQLQSYLQQMVQLKREQADAIGFEEDRYDALLDDYEPQARTTEIATTLAQLREALVPLIQTILDTGRTAPVEVLKRNFPLPAQQQFGTQAAQRIGFDFQRGRLDVTHHPFCTELGPHDCRITTRYHEGFFSSAFFGILHEAGHGIYEQGLRSDQYGLPVGKHVSLGIHESQSRMWENFVGRSYAFWQYFYPSAQQAFPQALGEVTLEQFFFAINDIRPSLIRVEADEATYNLHIVIRFELEHALINDQLQVADLPAAWNERYRQYLGITPENDAVGVLQDIHWSAALVGYFPTYALGNLYAAQLFQQADRDLGGLHNQFAAGEFQPLLQWLQKHVHQPGQSYAPAELVQRITGRPLSHEPLIDHLRQKSLALYAVG